MYIMAGTDPYYVDTHPEEAEGVVRAGYVRVMCWQNSACLQIREDVINQSQLMNFLASARPAENLSECIHLQNLHASADNVKVICDWLAKHIEFQSRNAPAEERRAFDRRFFLLNPAGHAAYDAAPSDQAKADILDSRKDWLRWRADDPENEDPARGCVAAGSARAPGFKRTGPVEERLHRTHEEIQLIMVVAEFLELHPTDWHVDFAKKEAERIAPLTPSTFQEYGLDPADKFAETVMELCCHHLGDMILGCESPADMQHRFPSLIGALTAKDIVDDFVTRFVPELQSQQKEEVAQAKASGVSEADLEQRIGMPSEPLGQRSMSCDSTAIQGGGNAVGCRTRLSAILREIGASQFLQKFIDHNQDDGCLETHIIPSQVSHRYGLPPQLAAAFVTKCHMPRLSAILEEIGAPPDFFQKFTETDARDGFCWWDSDKLSQLYDPLYVTYSDTLSQRYGLPRKLATAFVVEKAKCFDSDWSASMKNVEALKK